MMNPAVQALFKLLGDVEKIQAFAAIGTQLPIAGPDSLKLVVLYVEVPQLAKLLAQRDEQRVSALLRPNVECSPDTLRESLARVQAGLLELQRYPELHARLVATCPVVAELESIPAFGWQAYERMLNDDAPRCFGPGITRFDPSLRARGASRFDLHWDHIDAIFVTNSRMHYYAERLPLTMPAPAPQTFGEELRALDQLGRQALRLFAQCAQRGTAFHDEAPSSMRMRFQTDYGNAMQLGEVRTPPPARPLPE
jgi:hypothetical protein